MDCSTADVPTLMVQDSPGNESSSSDDFIPLSKLLARQHSEDKQSCERLTFSSSTKSKRDRTSDDSSDGEPLLKMKTIPAPAKTPVKKDNTSPRSNGTNNKKADVNTDESSDNEPLIKVAKMQSNSAKKPFLVSPNKSVDTKDKESLDNNDSSDDEPLSELAKKLHPKHQRKASVMSSREATPVMKSKRNAARKTVKYAVSSSDSSDDEALATTKRKLTKAPKEQKTLANIKKTKSKHKDKSLKGSSSLDSSSDDDDVPLVNLIGKRKPVKKNTKTTAVLQGSASRKRRGLSDESSEDEPLINLVKKNRSDKQTKNKTKALALKKRDATPKKPRKMPVSGSSSLDSSSDDDDVPLVNLIGKRKPVKRNTKTKAVSRGSASRKRRGLSDESSEDEPLINLVKKNRSDKQTKNKVKASALKKSDATPKKPRKMPVSGSSSNSSDDEPLINTVKHPQVTKILRIILERCDGEETGATQSLNKTSTDTLSAGKTSSEEAEGSEESPEEE